MSNNKRIPTKSYEKINQNYADALQWMKSIGVNLGSGRTQYYKKIVTQWNDRYRIATDKEMKSVFPDFLSSIFEIYDFIEIHNAFRDIPKAHLSHIAAKLQKGVNGPLNAAEETPKSTTARNFLFEATLAAKAHRPDHGIETILDAKSDTGIRIDKKKLWVECKRVTTIGKIESNVKKASKQVESVIKKQTGSGHRGIVALEITKILNVDDMIYVADNDSKLVAFSSQLMNDFIKKYSGIWQHLYKRRGNKIIGTIVRFAYMSASKERNLEVHTSQWGMNPSMEISLSDEKIQRDLALGLNDK